MVKAGNTTKLGVIANSIYWVPCIFSTTLKKLYWNLMDFNCHCKRVWENNWICHCTMLIPQASGLLSVSSGFFSTQCFILNVIVQAYFQFSFQNLSDLDFSLSALCWNMFMLLRKSRCVCIYPSLADLHVFKYIFILLLLWGCTDKLDNDTKKKKEKRIEKGFLFSNVLWCLFFVLFPS